MPVGRTITVEVKGVDELVRALKQKGVDAVHALAAELYKEAERVIAEAKPITPFDIGTLRNSGYVELPVIESGQVTVHAGFGGAAEAYAIFVHEDPFARHKPPTQYKFLEVTLNRMSGKMLERIGSGLKERLGL
jgi:hypothetical protein